MFVQAEIAALIDPVLIPVGRSAELGDESELDPLPHELRQLVIFYAI